MTPVEGRALEIVGKTLMTELNVLRSRAQVLITNCSPENMPVLHEVVEAIDAHVRTLDQLYVAPAISKAGTDAVTQALGVGDAVTGAVSHKE